MDCRGSVGLGLCLALATAGCQQTVTTLSPGGAATMPKPDASSSSVRKVAAAKKMKELPPAVMVSWGDFKAGEALAPDISSTRRQQIRDAAREDYERALKSDPKYVPAYQGLARLHTAMHNHDRAIELYQAALKLVPKSAVLWYELGMSHNYQRNWNAALECLNRASQLDPVNRQCTNALGIVLAKAGRYEESLHCFVRAGGEAMGHLRLSQTLQRLNQPELSRVHLQAALQKDPQLAVTLNLESQPSATADASVQPASYQAENVPASPASGVVEFTPMPAPPAPPAPPEPPRVIQVSSSVGEAQPVQLPILVPPPPSIPIHSDETPAPVEPNP